jgi:hypothetical protein
MGEQTDIEEYIAERGDDAAEVSKGLGRPRTAERTRVTTVHMCTAMKQLPNAEKIERIRTWIDTVDLAELIENACAAMLADAKRQRGNRRVQYKPISFDWRWETSKYATGNCFGEYEPLEELTDEVRTSIRIPVSVHDSLIQAANVLGAHPASVIRMALSQMYLDSGRSLAEAISCTGHLGDAYLPDLRVRERVNSVSALKRERRWLLENLELTTDSERRASIQAKIDAIKV